MKLAPWLFILFAGSAFAQPASELKRQEAIRLEGEGRVAEAIKAYTSAARSGSCDAAVRLGEIYDQGVDGVHRDYAESLKWYNAARVLGCDVPFPRPSVAQAPASSVAFTLDNRSPGETRSWVSGYAAALVQSGAACTADGSSPDAKPLLQTLNEKFKGRRITADEAGPTLYAAAVASYPCKK